LVSKIDEKRVAHEIGVGARLRLAPT
jgi:hypothetical protein